MKTTSRLEWFITAQSDLVLFVTSYLFEFEGGCCKREYSIDLERETGDIKALQRMCSLVPFLGVLSFIF
ncbi:hypothetical protein Syun_030249 [Stephania yunnanensis]|uniref:Uncharacterized protein n=1 Tax=Stephania yunnanensis TaxID=152371 RepID=A0AAP0HM48_9MAGN